MSIKLKVGDQVRVLSGKYKGQEGKILQVLPKLSAVVVEGVNIVKTHQKPSASNPNGGVQEKTMPIAISKVAFLTKSGKTSRLGFKLKADGKKVRVAKQDGNKEV
jgi:large subunit ribosomal protein L24